MLSPPYSPHADLVGELALDRVAGSKHVPQSMLSQIKAASASGTPSASRSLPIATSSTNSQSFSSSDELTDNDYDDDESSISEVGKHTGYKRSSSDAFLENCSESSTESGTTFSEQLSVLESAPRSVPLSRETSPTDVRERRMTTCWDELKTNPAKYLKRERSLLEMYPLRRHSWAGPGSSGFSSDDSPEMMGSVVMAASAVASISNGASNAGRRGRRSYRTPSGAHATSSTASSGRGRRRASPLEGSSSDSPSGTSDESGTQRGAGLGSASVRVHDLSLNQIKDYSPPATSLPPGKSLRAEWKGAPMDLSNDPDLHLLHPAEAHLASVLRLPCDVYLDSKRRLFAEKVHRLKQGLPFRRTDSQKACRIDVNKASRLFGAFEKIGWLEDELFMRFLD